MYMKKIILASFLFFTALGINVNAQSESTTEHEGLEMQTQYVTATEFQGLLERQDELLNIQAPLFDEYFDGITRQITYDRMIPPYALEVTFDKTVHIIFPSAVSYVDLGSLNIVAGKATGAENVVRVKAALKDFESETNLAVITADGSFYSFNIRYAEDPEKLNIEMKDFLHDGEAVNRPNNSLEIYLKELGNESPKLIYMINRSIHNNNRKHIRHIGSKRFGIQYLLKSIHSNNSFLYLHMQIDNKTNVPFDIDFIRMKIVDKKVAKRTAIQETVIYPIRAYNHITRIRGNKSERIVFTIDKITIPDDKQMVIELFEKNGGRNQSFIVENSDLIRAIEINDLKVD